MKNYSRLELNRNKLFFSPYFCVKVSRKLARAPAHFSSFLICLSLSPESF